MSSHHDIQISLNSIMSNKPQQSKMEKSNIPKDPSVKSNPSSKSERRENSGPKQEKGGQGPQRVEKGGTINKNDKNVANNVTKQGNPGKQASASASIPAITNKSDHHLALFDHLQRKFPAYNIHSIESDKSLHPATTKLGLLYRYGHIRDDDDRVTALLGAFDSIIQVGHSLKRQL